jgi:hypothetical protein
VAFGLALVPRALLVEAVLEVLTVLLIVARRFIFDPNAYFHYLLVVIPLLLCAASVLRWRFPLEPLADQDARGSSFRSRLLAYARPSSLIYPLATAIVLSFGWFFYLVQTMVELSGGFDLDVSYPESRPVAALHFFHFLYLSALFVLLVAVGAVTFVRSVRPSGT